MHSHDHSGARGHHHHHHAAPAAVAAPEGLGFAVAFLAAGLGTRLLALLPLLAVLWSLVAWAVLSD